MIEITIFLPGKRTRKINIIGYEQIIDIKKQVADNLSVDAKNWGIYLPGNGRLILVDDSIAINKVNCHKLHFYPKAVIR